MFSSKFNLIIIVFSIFLIMVCLYAGAKSAKQKYLADQVAAFALSPDGKQVAYADNQGLKTMAVRGSKAKLLLKLSFLPVQWEKDSDWPVDIGTNIAWSPDGKKIAVAAVFLTEKKSKLTIVDVASGKTQIIHKAMGYGGIGWSPDSRRLAWVSNDSSIKLSNGKYVRQAGQIGLYICSSAAPKPVIRMIYTFSKHGDGFGPHSLSWLPSGDIAIDINGAQFGLVKPDGSNLRAIPAANKPGNRTGRWVKDWSASPDGAQIAYNLLRGYGEDNNSIWTYKVSNGNIKKISDQYRPLEVAWSSDGRGLWFVNAGPGAGGPGMRYNPCPPQQLHWISADGRRHRKVREENDVIRNIRCAKDGTVFYISGRLLCIARKKDIGR